jgi:hypothetical protein
MKIELENCMVAIDAEATREYYARRPVEPICGCGCEYCRSFIAHAHRFSDKVKEFFASCGIDDLLCVTEISPLYEKEGFAYVDGWFFAVGSMEGGDPPQIWVPPLKGFRGLLYKLLFTGKKRKENERHIEELLEVQRMSRELKIDDDFSVYFMNSGDLIPADFPENHVAIKFCTRVPLLPDEG